MSIYCRYLFTIFISALLMFSCSRKEQTSDEAHFQKLSPEQTGVTFSNTITTNDSLNMLNNVFIYNGGGVATGDINNDDLPDLFFTGNMVSSRLYLNKGNMAFEDITESAGLSTDRWATGATMVDINGDQLLDIYVSFSGSRSVEPEKRRNLLFVNNGDTTFTEAASEYNIDDTGFTTHAVFLDYDRDGDLDLFLLGNSPEEFSRGETGSRPMGGEKSANPEGFDQLYRNNGDGTFTNVSREAGMVRKLGYGLGVAVSDLNRDGWPDIYVSNDLTPNDVLYVNNRDGTFSNKAAEWLRHTSFAGMGIDIADFTNNGWPDIMQIDMMPEELSNRKRMSGSITYSGFMNLRRRGYFPHYNINTLQMNLGKTDDGRLILSEIARMAGVAYTNWSWSSLFGDFDNDGYKDLFITNGFPKMGMDLDYLSDKQNAGQAETREMVQQRRRELLENLPGYKIPNYIFRNEGDLTYSNRTRDWGMDQPGFSYGASYADLNNDGRLDLVVNNINLPAFIYENTGSEEHNAHYLKIDLQGESPNTGGIGTRLILSAGGKKQFIYHNPYRGFKSTMDGRIHFGLGDAVRADSLEVIWPDGRRHLLTDLQADQKITVKQVDAPESRETNSVPLTSGNRVFQQMEDPKKPDFKHQQYNYTDFNAQPLLPYMISRQGPPTVTGDVNGDGLEDLFIGGSAGQSGKLFIQNEDGGFTETGQYQPWQEDSNQEDWGALFFDANGDGLPDLYVASGGYHFSPVSLLLQDRLYINHGDGRFLKDTEALPDMLTSTSSVTAGDFNGDGRPDLFVGGRLKPRDYPHPSRSYLLRNDGGRFTDVTRETAPELMEPGGMITDAVWIDYNRDERTDLVTAGEWMPIKFYENDGERLNNVTGSTGLPPMRGWWYSLEAGDFNKDGHPDLAAGNLGLNHNYTTSKNSKFGVVAGNFSGLRTTDVILTKEVNGTEYPYYGLVKLAREIYTLGLKFQSFESFANSSVRDVFGSSALEGALRYQADTFASVWMQNNGDGTFSMNKLPNMAQISPVNDILTTDVDGDGNPDLIVAGNMYHSEPTGPRADAGNGLWLKGDGRGDFSPVPPIESGFLAPLNVKNLSLINGKTGRAVVVANNDDSVQIFNIQRSN